MAKTPNKGKGLNFTAKIWDEQAQAYRPIYIAPDATDTIQGDVILSDDISDLDAATGMTAATPKAVKFANDNANKKLDKEQSAEQTVVSPVTFSGKVTGNDGFAGNLTGDVTGNADTATKLKTARTISVKGGNDATSVGSVSFNGSSDSLIVIPQIDASIVNTGTLPLSVIPQGALENLIKVDDEAKRFALTVDQVQLGDSVLQIDTGVMYIVVDQNKLNSAEGYQEYKAATALNAANADEAVHAISADKLTTKNVGSTAQPIYINTDGIATASNSEIGASNKPIYMSAGILTASSSTIGSGTRPIFMTGGALTASTSTVGANTANAVQPVFMNNGVIAATTASSGAANKPVWLNGGKLVPGTYTIDKSVPSNAIFTDTWIAMKGSTANADGEAGYVPAPTAGEDNRFLRNDGTWQKVESGVTSVNGETGAVTVTPKKIGAVRITGDRMLGDLTPNINNSLSLGTSDLKWSNIYATTANIGTVIGSLQGTATNATNAVTANRLNKTLSLDGNVFGSVSLNTDGNPVMAATIRDGAVSAVKLASDVGIVAVSETQPSDDNVKIWIQTV